MEKENTLAEDFEIILGILGTTQREVAKLMIIPETKLNSAIEGKRPLGDQFLRRLSKELGIYLTIRNGKVTFMLEDWAKDNLENLRSMKSIDWGLSL